MAYVADAGRNVIAARGGGRIALVPGDAPVMLPVEVSQPLPAEQRLMVQWVGEQGEHAEWTGIRPPSRSYGRGTAPRAERR
jgi:hypothetical protein